MDAKKIVVIIGVVIAIIIVGVIVYSVFLKNGGTNVIENQAPTGGTGQAISVAAAYPNAPTGQYISIGTADGTVQVNNFYTSSATEVGEDGILIIKQTPTYWFTYDPSDSSFWIALSGTPLGAVQQTAEQDFLTTLGVSTTVACKLNVSEGQPYVAGSPTNGQSLPLSFCK